MTRAIKILSPIFLIISAFILSGTRQGLSCPASITTSDELARYNDFPSSRQRSGQLNLSPISPHEFFRREDTNLPTEPGEISADNKYAWGENLGWINFSLSKRSLRVGSNILSGWIRIEKVGLVHLGNGRPQNGFQYSNSDFRDYGVNNDGFGNLSGWAWGENVGWINFDQVRIDRAGVFTGRAGSAKIGLITLHSRGPIKFLVKTDPYPWKKIGARREYTVGSGPGSGNRGEILNPASPPLPGNCPTRIKISPAALSSPQEAVNAGIVSSFNPETYKINFCLPAGSIKNRGPPSDNQICTLIEFGSPLSVSENSTSFRFHYSHPISPEIGFFIGLLKTSVSEVRLSYKMIRRGEFK